MTTNGQTALDGKKTISRYVQINPPRYSAYVSNGKQKGETMEGQTTAEKIMELFDDGSECWHWRVGDGLSEACEVNAARRSERGDSVKWVFGDGSSIVEASGGWDLGLDDDPDCYCWDGCRGDHPETDGHNPHCASAPDPDAFEDVSGGMGR